jgi:iron complex outermembrane receptor protein
MPMLVCCTAQVNANAIEEIVVRTDADNYQTESTRTISAGLPAWQFSDLVSASPDLALTGQGGRLQTFSIRGFSAERIRLLIDRAPIRALRRAGTSLTFVIPEWSNVAVSPGSAAAAHGSGTLGGIVQSKPSTSVRRYTAAAYEGPGARRELSFSAGAEHLQGALGYFAGSKQQAPDGTVLNTGFEQLSGQLMHQYSRPNLDGSTILLFGRGRDIGKSRSDYPDRTSVYPRDDHLFLSHTAEFQRAGRFDLWLHSQTLHTNVLQGNRLDEVRSSSLDYGLRYLKQTNERLSVGIDLLGRTDFDTHENGLSTLSNGRENELAAYVVGFMGSHKLMFDWGARATGFIASADDQDSFSQRDLIGHLGLTVFPSESSSLRVSTGRTATHPTLSQLFFSGATPRGVVVGNENLGSESAWVVDARFRSRIMGLAVQLDAYYSDIDSFIEKVSLEDGVDTFINADGGEIYGATIALGWQRSSWSVGLGASTLRGTLDSGQPIRDLPEAQLNFTAASDLGPGKIRLVIDHRFESDRVSPANRPVDDRTLVGLGYKLPVGDTLLIEAFVKNLLNETYRETNDSRAPLGPERSFGLRLSADF